MEVESKNNKFTDVVDKNTFVVYLEDPKWSTNKVLMVVERWSKR